MSLHIDFRERINKIRSMMAKKNIGVLVVTTQSNIAYVMGCVTPWRTAVVIPIEGEIMGTTMINDADRVQKETWVKIKRGWELALKEPTLIAVIKEIIKDLGDYSGKIGLEFNDLTIEEFNAFIKELNPNNIIDSSEVIAQVMVLKEEVEIYYLKRAAQIADKGMNALFEHCKVGVSEIELAGIAEKAMRDAGNEWAWGNYCNSEVGSGERTSWYQGWTSPPTRKLIQDNDMMIIDLHPMYNLYLSDVAANAVIGNPSPEQHDLIEAWKEGVYTLLDSLKPGLKGKEVALKTIKILQKNGYADAAIPLYGHGLGTSCRIAPTIAIDSEDILKPNMAVVAVLNMTKPGIGGLRIETPVLITNDKPERLSKIPIEPVIIER